MFCDEVKNRINFIKKECIEISNDKIILEETKEEGKAKLDIEIKNPCIAFKKLDERKSPYLSLLKCADDIIFENKDDTWILHIIEFKCKVNMDKWIHIKEQFRGAFLNALAISGYLGITLDLKNVKLYTGFRKDKLSNQILANPVMLKRQVGKSCCNNDYDDWSNGQVILQVFEKMNFSHQKIPLDKDTGEGKWVI